jgi:uncharacterized protein YkwD
MGVMVKKSVFVSHGKEFETKAEADKYDALHTARKEYEDAQHKLQQLLAETQKTADGQAFEFGVFHDYHTIVTFYGFPVLTTVSFMCWNWTVQEDEFGVSIKEDRGRDDRFFRITSLYADKRNAEKALAAAQSNELIQLTQRTNELRKTVGLKPLKAPAEQV